MAISNKVRVGIVGVSPNRGFASIAHIPALKALPEFDISAVCQLGRILLRRRRETGMNQVL
jgi:predicted dehydrogenase